MIKKVFIANRGEVALRIIRAARELKIKTVLGYSEADKAQLYLKEADETICIGAGSSDKSYLNVNAIIHAAIHTGCDAIHPGIGFLSENASFVKAVEESGLIFIGPSFSVMALLGSKIESRIKAKEAGFEVTPGGFSSLETVEDAIKEAKSIGYPIILKAALGGGGKGMRVVESEEEMASAFKLAKEEALKFFNDSSLHIEAYIQNPRHIELQLISDGETCIFLGERECSVQRNHQKLIEESPSVAITDEQRESLKRAGINLFKSIGYKGAGTIEFLYSRSKLYFMEVNARVQVEHGVSEIVTGFDIMKALFEIFMGRKGVLNLVPSKGLWAIECRVNAKTTGTITSFNPPMGPWVRVDTYLRVGAIVSPLYDSMVAKVITWGPTRAQALARMNRSLAEFEVEGIKTNLEEQLKLINSKPFVTGAFDTGLYEKLLKEGII